MENKKNGVKHGDSSRVSKYYFNCKPSKDSVILKAEGKYLSSAFIAVFAGVDHQSIVDQALAVPPSIIDGMIVIHSNYVEIHSTLLPDFGVNSSFISDYGVTLQ